MEQTGADPTLSRSELSEQSIADSSIPENNITTIISPTVSQNTPSTLLLSEQIEQAWNAAIDAPEEAGHPLNISDTSGSSDRQNSQHDPPQVDEQNSAQDAPAPNPTHSLRAPVESLLNRFINAITSSLFRHNEAQSVAQDDTSLANAESSDPTNAESTDAPASHDHVAADPETQNVDTTTLNLNSNNERVSASSQPTADDASNIPRPSQFLMYIPQDASPFPFGFLYDAGSSMAWPILNQFEQPQSDETDENHRTVHVLGRPFRLIVTVNTGGPQEEPDENKAHAYVKGLEVVDADLRARMQHLGMSDISEYGISSDDRDSNYVTGCCVCLEPYPEEDKPSWLFDEEQELMKRIIALPCIGFHTMHGACIFNWLKSKPPSKWTCPYCRSPLDPNHPTLNDGSTKDKPQTIREYVRSEERRSGWRCDAPTCFPDYDTDSKTSHMIKLFPCRHQIHLDCLCTCMRLQRTQERGSFSSQDEDNDTSDYEEESDSNPDDAHDVCRMSRSEYILRQNENITTKQDTVGKWVTCAACRKDAWAELPTRQRPRPRHQLYSHLSKSTNL